MSRVVVLEDALLVSMAKHPEYIKEFPWLKSLNTASKGCGKCGAGKARAALFGHMKSTVLRLPPDKIAKLKELSQADELHVYVPDAAKKIQKHVL